MTDLVINSSPKLMRRNILRLAWPAVLRLFFQSIVGVVDVIMVGKLGSSAIASVDMGNRLVFVLIGTLMSTTIGATALVAHNVGAGNKEKANYILSQTLIAGTFAALLLSSFGFIFSRNMLGVMMVLMEETDMFILNSGSIYLKIVFVSMVFALPTMVINSVMQGLGDMKTPMFIMFCTNITNVIFNYLLIFGIGFFPEMGIAGAATGTMLGRLVGFMVAIVVLMKGRSDLKLKWNRLKLKIDWKIIGNILRIGIPAAIEQLVRQSSQIIYTVLVGSLGTQAIAANAVTMNVSSLSFLPGFGFGMAATTLVGQSLGAKNEAIAEKYGKQTTYITIALMIFASIIMFVLINPIVRLYTDDPEVISMASSTMKIFIALQPLFCIFMVLAGALRGAGDTKWVMYFTIIGNWGIRLAFSYFFAFYLDLGLNGFWFAMGVDVTIRAGLIVRRFLSGRWKTLKVIDRNIVGRKMVG